MSMCKIESKMKTFLSYSRFCAFKLSETSYFESTENDATGCWN